MTTRFLHIALALLLLLSSTGLMLDKHYCQDELKDIVVFGEAKACHADQQMPNCPFHGKAQQSSEGDQKDCCDDTTEYVKAEQEQSFFFADLDLQIASPGFPASFFESWALAEWDQQITVYSHYKPPLLTGDLSSELQVFLC